MRGSKIVTGCQGSQAGTSLVRLTRWNRELSCVTESSSGGKAVSCSVRTTGCGGVLGGMGAMQQDRHNMIWYLIQLFSGRSACEKKIRWHISNSLRNAPVSALPVNDPRDY